MVSKHGAVTPAPVPLQVLHVTAPTPSDHSHCSEDGEHRSVSSAYSTAEHGASPQYLSVLSKFPFLYVQIAMIILTWVYLHHGCHCYITSLHKHLYNGKK